MSENVLHEFTQKEMTLLNKMLQVGYFHVLEKFNVENNIYDQWSEIFLAYADFALKGNLEALKRALFFIWYEEIEPHELTGIKDLDKTMAFKVLSKINTMLLDGTLDAELRFFLAYYYSICDWYFAKYEGLEALRKYSENSLKVSENYTYEEAELFILEKNNYSFENRGMLGDYWLSIRPSQDKS